MTDDAGAKIIDLSFGRWRSQILYAGVKLGVFDALADGRKSAIRVTRELNVDAACSTISVPAGTRLATIGLTSQGSQCPTAFAPASLPLPAAAERRRGGSRSATSASDSLGTPARPWPGSELQGGENGQTRV